MADPVDFEFAAGGGIAAQVADAVPAAATRRPSV
jgi:hypothetical protein